MSTQFTNRQWRLPNNENKDKQSNYSMDFDSASSDYINIGNSTDLSFERTNAFTISAWIKTNATSTQVILNKLISNVGYQFFINSAGNLGFYAQQSASVYIQKNSTATFNNNSWHHVVISYDGSSNRSGILLYTNGNLATTTDIGNASLNSTIVNSTNALIGNSFSGQIDGVAIYNYALSSSQVTTLYGSSSTGIGNPMSLSPKPVAYYPLGDQDAFNGASYLTPNASLKDFVFNGIPGGTKLINSNINQSNTGSKLTVSFWQNPSSSGLLTFNHGGTGIGEFRSYSNRPIVFLASDYFQYFDTQTLVPGEWKHYVVFMDTSNVANSKLWINGASINQSTTHSTGSANSFTSGLQLNFGNFPEGSNMMYFTNYEINQTNVDVLYNNGSPITSTLGLSTAPDHWWKLNASDTYDSSTGNWTIEDHAGTNDGTSSGMTQANLVQSDLSFTSGYSPYALDFDAASSDYIDCGDSDDFSFGDGTTDSPFSVSAWVNMVDATRFYLLSKGLVFSSNYEYLFNTNASDILGLYLYDSSENSRIGRIYNTALTTFEGQWIHVCATYNGSGLSSGIKLYLNGTQVNSLDSNSGTYEAMENGNRPLNIGRSETGTYANGSISNVSVWNTELTSSQVSEIYNEGIPQNLNNHSAYSNLVSWWQLGSNTSWVDPYWIALDEKGTNNGQSQNVAAPNNMGENAIVDGVGSYANGLSSGMGGDEVIGDAPYSTANALSVNMDVEDRVTDTPS